MSFVTFLVCTAGPQNDYEYGTEGVASNRVTGVPNIGNSSIINLNFWNRTAHLEYNLQLCHCLPPPLTQELLEDHFFIAQNYLLPD
jgi:hypothetical protein